MKRTIKLSAKNEDEKVEIIIKLDADHSSEWNPRGSVNKRMEKIIDSITKRVLMEDLGYNFSKIKAHKK